MMPISLEQIGIEQVSSHPALPYRGLKRPYCRAASAALLDI